MKERTRRFVIYVLPAIAYAVAIFTVSSIPSIAPPFLGVSWDDKIYHFIEYAGFSVLVYRAFRFWEITSPLTRRLLLTLFFGACTAMVDELHQLYIRGRAAEVYDWFADFAGVLFGILMLRCSAIIRAAGGKRN